MITREGITGVVLAGGLSRRMNTDGGTRDKGLVMFRGRPMIGHVIGRLAPQVGHLLVNVGAAGGSGTASADESANESAKQSANTALATYQALGLKLVTDQLPGRPGPLAGLHAAMVVADTRWVACAPCDAPFLPEDLLTRLCVAAESLTDAEVAVAVAGGRLQPVFLLARRNLADSIADYLAGGGRAVEGWLRARRFAQAEFADVRAFTNLNTPDELHQHESA